MIPILLICLTLISTDQAKSPSLKGQITDFSASDMPYDDGAGIILKWKPLDKSHRIIAYHIYRGVSKDSLFLTGTIEVDPKTGVMAPQLFYYDRGDQPLIEFETAPSRLRKERQQTENSPLYRRFPQDAKLLGSVLDRYNVLAAVKSSKFYHKSVPIKQQDDIAAGMKLYNMEYVYAMPMPGTKYYYTVLAINERGRYLPYADIQEVMPVDNPPEAKAVMNSTFIQDTGVFNFEWNLPLSSPDIAMWEAWLVPKGTLGAYGEALPDTWQNSAINLFQIPNTNIYNAPTLYHQVSAQEAGINLPNNMQDYGVVFAYADYAGQTAAVSAKHFRILNSSQLPKQENYRLLDKPNDKGDNMVVSIGKPIAYVSNASFMNQKKSILKINYEVSENEFYDIQQMEFQLLNAKHELVGKTTEHFLDRSVRFNLPKKYHGLSELIVRIGVYPYNSTSAPEFTEQELDYDPINKLFSGKQIIYKGEALTGMFYDILSKLKTDPDFQAGNRTNALARTYDHLVPYEDMVYKPLSGYDAKHKALIMPASLQIDADSDNGYSFDAALFRDKFNADLKKKENEVAELKKAIAAYPAGSVPDSLTQNLAYTEGNYNFITQHPAYKEANKAGSEKEWLKTLISARQSANRTVQYKLLKTDGMGAFSISPVYTDKSGKNSFTPAPEWFDTTKVITLIASLLLCVLLIYAIIRTKKGKVYIRPIAGLHEIDNAIGRATEMGRPVMFVPGWGTIGDVCTIASMMILGQISKKTAEFDIRLLSPHCDYMVLPLAQEIVQTAYNEVGRPDAYNQNDIFFISDNQFPFCAGVNGITVRERVATIFYMGFFNAEALLLTETGNQAGSIQIAGTDAVTQIPFFITTCDYTLIGEEFYAASAYLSGNHELVSMLKAQDYFKLVIVFMVILGTILSTFHFNALINAFPVE